LKVLFRKTTSARWGVPNPKIETGEQRMKGKGDRPPEILGGRGEYLIVEL